MNQSPLTSGQSSRRGPKPLSARVSARGHTIHGFALPPAPPPPGPNQSAPVGALPPPPPAPGDLAGKGRTSLRKKVLIRANSDPNYRSSVTQTSLMSPDVSSGNHLLTPHGGGSGGSPSTPIPEVSVVEESSSSDEEMKVDFSGEPSGCVGCFSMFSKSKPKRPPSRSVDVEPAPAVATQAFGKSWTGPTPPPAVVVVPPKRPRIEAHAMALSARGPSSLGGRPVWKNAASAMPTFNGHKPSSDQLGPPDDSTDAEASTSFEDAQPGKEVPPGPAPPSLPKPPASQPPSPPLTLSAKLAPRVKPLLVLDMDETLLRSEPNGKEKYDLLVKAGEEGAHEVFVKVRPYCKEFLKACSKFCRLYVFTASNQDYCDPVLDAVDTEKLIEKRFYNPDCTKYDGKKYEKDLRKLGHPLRQVILVDNSPDAWRNNPQNAIHIQSWFGNSHDTQLLDLIPVLETLFTHYHDVREVLNANTRSFKSLCDRSKRLNPKIWGKYQTLRKPEHKF